MTYISLFSDAIRCFEHFIVDVLHTLENDSV